MMDMSGFTKTYFIYQCGRIRGPFTVQEILGQCVRNEIHLRSEKVLFCLTSLSNSYCSGQHCKVWSSLEELKQTGCHQQLYSALSPLLLVSEAIHRPPPPHIADDRKWIGIVSLHQMVGVLSVIISKSLFLVISLHLLIPLVLSASVYCALFIFCCSSKKRSLFSPYSLCLFIVDTMTSSTCSSSRCRRTNDSMTSLVLSGVSAVTETHFVSVFVGFTCSPILVLLSLHSLRIDIGAVYTIGYAVWCSFFLMDYLCINLQTHPRSACRQRP